MIVRLISKLRSGVSSGAEKRIQRVSVLIQEYDGKQFLVAPDYFIDRHGVDRSVLVPFGSEKDAAKRVMRMLHHDVQKSDYEIVPVPNLGKLRTYYVVWFPSLTQFNAETMKFDFQFSLVDQRLVETIERANALLAICKRASQLHETRLAEKVA